jgi:hypothetical protein
MMEPRREYFPELSGGSNISAEHVFERIMSLVNADGSVTLDSGEIEHSEQVDLSALSPEERRNLQLAMAQTLFRHVSETAWLAEANDETYIRFRNYIEPHLALRYSLYRYDPQFLLEIPRIVDQVIEKAYLQGMGPHLAWWEVCHPYSQ